MTDISASLSTILVQAHSSQVIAGPPSDISQTLDSFLQEAHQINRSISSLLSYLQTIRTPYLLSTISAPRLQKRAEAGRGPTGSSPHRHEIPEHLNDAQREAIDTETSSVLRDLNSKITNLSSAVNLQHDTATKVLEKKYGKPNGIFWRWAAGDQENPDVGKPPTQLDEEGRVKTTKMFRDGVLWFLGKRLKDVITTQQEMVEKRLERERQKQLSVLADPRNKGLRPSRPSADGATGGTAPSYGDQDLRAHDAYKPWAEGAAGGPEQDLSPEQMQLFEEENRVLFELFNDQLAKITHVEKSLVEISSLQQTLVSHLSVQGDLIDTLVTDAANTDENVRKGNRELKRASERGSTARLVFYATAGLCSFLVVWDLIF